MKMSSILSYDNMSLRNVHKIKYLGCIYTVQRHKNKTESTEIIMKYGEHVCTLAFEDPCVPKE